MKYQNLLLQIMFSTFPRTTKFSVSGFITKCSVVYARLSPRGSRNIDRMTNVPGSRRLHRGLVNQEIFSISMFREALLFFHFFFFLFIYIFSIFYTNITSSLRRSARKPHVKSNIARADCKMTRCPRVNLTLAELYFFSRCVCHGLSVNYSPGVNQTHMGRSR